MSSLIFDLEADGLLKEATKVHCIAILDADTGDTWSYGPDDIEKGLDELYQADTIVAHNGTTYDIPLLKKLFGWHRRPGSRLVDTLVVARLLRPNVAEEDRRRVEFPPKLIGSHSLRAWGMRLGEYKGDFEGPWDTWTQEMQDYCEQDVRVTFRLLNHLKPWEYPPVPLDLEHRVAEVCHLMWAEGWTFDKDKATTLYTALVKRRDELEKALVEKYGQWQELDKVLIPKRDNKRLGYTKGVPVEKYKTVVFNPGSRVHIEKKLREAGWEPQEFTESGRAKLDESVLARVELPEASLLVQYLLVQKRLGQVGDGDSGWLRLVEADGRIHGTINPCGTVTGRATHRTPNVSQVPSNRAPYGKDCRACFRVPEGWKLVGADMAALELRAFAHYLHRFDKGEYAKVVTEGDVHTHNQKLAGLDTRDEAKRFIYATLYGASARKLGTITGRGEKDGVKMKQRFITSLPAYKKLMDLIKQSLGKGWLKGLDGRRLYIRSEHSALNMLLQACGAILCKQWIVSFYDQMCAIGYTHGHDCDFVIYGWIHDAIYVACREGLEGTVGTVLEKSAEASGEPFGFMVPLSAEHHIGDTWADV
jgi:DNA polymerase I-like protein with 3'-5' exonuclease and polymerase domains